MEEKSYKHGMGGQEEACVGLESEVSLWICNLNTHIFLSTAHQNEQAATRLQ